MSGVHGSDIIKVMTTYLDTPVIRTAACRTRGLGLVRPLQICRSRPLSPDDGVTTTGTAAPPMALGPADTGGDVVRAATG